MQVRLQECIFFHSSIRGLKDICEVILERQSMAVPLPLFWPHSSTLHFYQTFESTSSLLCSSFSDHNIPGQHANNRQVSGRESSLHG